MKTYDEWRQLMTVRVPPGVDAAFIKEVEDALLLMYDEYVRDEQFKFEMTAYSYGIEETADAKAWFNTGWAAKARS